VRETICSCFFAIVAESLLIRKARRLDATTKANHMPER